MTSLRKLGRTLVATLFLPTGPLVSASLPAPIERVERSDDQLLILSLDLDTHRLSDGIFAFSDKRGVLLPLGQLVDALELAMEVDIERGRVQGWVLDPEQPFELDFVRRTVTLHGVAQSLATDARVEAHWDDLYVDAELLASWWQVEIHVDLSRLRAVLTTESPLPIARRLDRRAQWAQANSHRTSPQARQAKLPELYEPYGLLDWPALDGALDVAWRRSNKGESSRLARYSALAQGDFLGLTADLFWSGAQENGTHRITGRRFSLSRTDPDAGLLGPMGATEVRLGDLLGLAHPLITHGRGGRGLAIERAPTRRGSHFDHTTLQGDVIPGWDVELYRGNQLLDFQTAGADGRYEFRDIPLWVGRNDLRILMFGPHGEQRERVERILVGPGALPPGEIRYRVDLVEQGRGTLGAVGDPGRGLSEGVAIPGLGEMALGGHFEYGLTRRWTASAGALSLPVETEGNSERHAYTWLGLEGSWLGTANRLEVVRDFEGGWAGRIAAQRRFGAVGLRLEHRQFFSFLSELHRQSGSTGLTELRLDSQIPLRGRRRMPLTFLSTWEQRETGAIFRARGELSYTAKLGDLRLANRWGFELANDDVSARGRSTLHGRLGRLPIRGRFAYEVWPRAELNSLNLDIRWQRRQTLTSTFGIDYDLRTRVARLRAGLDWQTRQQIFAMSLESSSDGSLALQLGTRFSLRRDAASRRYRLRSDASAKQAVAKVQVFLDDNGNGSFDTNEEALENVAFELGGGRHSVTTDEDGLAYLPLGSHQRTDLTLAEGSLEDPYWVSSSPGAQVLTRPGRTEFITFPIIATGEIDGTVYLVRGEGKRAIGGVKLDLIDEDGDIVSSVESQYDGFYLFEKVRPGKYRLLISPAAADRWNLDRLKPIDLVVSVGGIHSGADFHVELQEKGSGTSHEL